MIGTKGVRGEEPGERPPLRAWKISGQALFSGQAQFSQKSRMMKDISIEWKIPGQAQVAQKSGM